MMLRTFIAIETPDFIRNAALEIQGELRKFNCRVSWTAASSLHLTLKFLGDTPDSESALIADALSEVAQRFPPLELGLSRTGVFGGGKPRVLWLGITAIPTLNALQKAVEGACAKLGFPPEGRDYHPHLTLGRVKEPEGTSEMVENLKNIKLPEIRFSAEELVFFKSELFPSGAVHTPLNKFRFSGKTIEL